MKIYAGWYAACAVLCVCAHPSRDRSNERYTGISRSFNPKSIANGYGFERQMSATKLFEIFEDSEEFEEKKGPSTMRAIITRARGNPVLLPLIIEPEAEMLPVGYEGVKSPGVTHMELAFAKPQTGRPSGRKNAALRRASATDDGNPGKSDGFNRDNDAHYAASKHETKQVARDDHGNDSLAVFEVGSKGDTRKENEKAEHAEVSGASKSHSENEDRAEDHKEEVVKETGATYETGDAREKARNTARYRNVYHKDEFKKDADFYSNGRQGGHFERHGRYGEKHAAAEGEYAKGGSNGSRFVEVEANERRNEKKTEGNREAQGHPKTDSSGTWTDS
ncbi:PREDICTED: uncharacterized protein LOC105453692 [Wasmannia auropunctata]|uniref:uncharacterized protein LOC105453692 n=1 Tax=Wasmannia auropunctata TaxID=64793 RepID=UPI0005EFCE90|nr:PREDICTED: uncharacterized protein LOC105453692 [Wasmannia auropunctata]